MARTIEELSSKTGFNKDILYKTILEYGNDINEKLLHFEDGEYFVSQDLFSSFINRRKDSDYQLKDIDKLRELRVDFIPIKPKPVVYFLFNGRNLIYIGQSINLLGRISSHNSDKTFDKIAMIEVDNNDLLEVEALYINKYKPKINIICPSERDVIRILLESM